MGLSFRVVKSELTAAAQTLQQHLDAFRASTVQTRNAADNLCSMWEGDARNAFVAEQNHNFQLYQDMERAVVEFISAMKEAETSYSEADQTCAQLLRTR